MSDPTAPPDDRPHRQLAGGPLDGDPGAVPPPVRCRLTPGSGPGFTAEMSCLLPSRLRLSILVLLVGLTLHFLRNVFRLGATYDHRLLWLLFSACEIVVMLAASAWLWSRRLLSMRHLRAL